MSIENAASPLEKCKFNRVKATLTIRHHWKSVFNIKLIAPRKGFCDNAVKVEELRQATISKWVA